MPDKELMITLWNHCNNRCTFCYNQGFYNLPINLKQHLVKCNNLLKSNRIKDYTCVRLVGGELFDGAIDQLNVRHHFTVIENSLLLLLNKNIIKNVNVVTNLLYEDVTDLIDFIDKFEYKMTLSTSYDYIGRFSSHTETIWWNNLKQLKKTYPNLKIDIGINITQPLIENISKVWLDNFKENTDCDINFNELFSGIDQIDKQDCNFSELFPKRKDFLQFLKNLRDWGYLNCITETKDIKLMHYVFDGKTGKAIIKDTSKISDEKHRQDGYIDSDVAMCDDIRRFRNANR